MSTTGTTALGRIGAFIHDDEGIAMALVVAVAGILFILLTALVTVTVGQGTESSNRFQHTEVLDVADAGISAYIRQLRQDGNWYSYLSSPTMTGTSGRGTWTVTCTQPDPNSQVLKLVSVATVPSQGTHRIVTAFVRPGSFADYMFLINADIHFGSTAIVSGKVHSNGDILVDSGGVIYGTASVSSTHTINSKTSPFASASFMGNPAQVFNAAQIDFTSITSDLGAIKTKAISQGAYYSDAGTSTITKKPFLGYNVVLNGTNYTVSKVASENPTTGQLSLETSTAVTRSIPASGEVYFDTEPIWVTGTYSTSITLGDSVQTVDNSSLAATSGAGGAPNSAVYLPENLVPQNPSDSKQVLGIVAPGDISFPSWTTYAGAPTSYTVSAALLSQNGGIHADFSQSPARSKNGLTILGSMVSQAQSGFVSGSIGFQNRTYTYDRRFWLNPPPGFPRPTMGDKLSLDSWYDTP